MSTETTTKTSSLRELVAPPWHAVHIPMIQRDYAQGRPSWANARKRFLDTLKDALSGGKSQHLDFIYGIRQQEDGLAAFCPLDGQQRLTTLFLLHWYLAAHEGCFDAFRNTFRTEAGESRFSYQIRPGGRSFFRELVNRSPSANSGWPKPADWIREQSWFRTIWERDPSVAGALTMLDAIHECFRDVPVGCYSRLTDGNQITFQVLDLGAAGLHDDLYLRMNARGRPLTSFETFKARYEKHLESVFPEPTKLARCGVQSAKDFSYKIDTDWLDFIWNHYVPKAPSSENTSWVDGAFINLFRAVALVSLPPKKNDVENRGEQKIDAVTKLTEKDYQTDYDDFESGGWLTCAFTVHLIHMLEACAKTESVSIILLEKPWFGDGSLLDRMIRREDQKPTLTDYLQFAACIRFLSRHGPVLDETMLVRFHDWMRVVRNLVLNTEVEAANFQQVLKGLDELLEGSEVVFQFLLESGEKFTGLNEAQTKEERLKAFLWLAHEDWKDLIKNAENHPYFQGQIGFLLVFAGASAEAATTWSASDHADCLHRFRTYLSRACEMFGPGGFISKPDFLWERALLTIGDYLLLNGGNIWSFLVDDRSKPASWKRFLRDDHQGKRFYLKTLWDRLEKNESLEHIAADLPQEAWRNALCSTPAAWTYCRQRLIRYEIRKDMAPRAFLLSAKRRGARYAELFTYCLMEQTKLDTDRSLFAPLIFDQLVQDTKKHDDPHLRLKLERCGTKHVFHLYCQYGEDTGYSLWLPAKDLDAEFIQLLETGDFKQEICGSIHHLVRRQNPGDPLNGRAFLKSVAAVLNKSTQQT